jgi:hypothetical protein
VGVAEAAPVTDRWHDNWRDEETPEEKIERRYATVDKLGEWSGQDKPTLMDTAKRLNAIKGEYGLSGEGPDEEAMRASRAFAVDKFRELGIDYEDVHALAIVAGMEWADMLIAALRKAQEMNEDELRVTLTMDFGDTWIDGVLLGATHRKAVE